MSGDGEDAALTLLIVIWTTKISTVVQTIGNPLHAPAEDLERLRTLTKELRSFREIKAREASVRQGAAAAAGRTAGAQNRRRPRAPGDAEAA